MTAPSKMLSLAQVAEALNLSVSDVAGLIDAGELPAANLAGKTRVAEDALAAYLDQQLELQRRESLWHESQSASIVDLFSDQHN